ncbi:MAG: SufD family Fe-S cluster assembly protein [Candidatus Margulisiibacteriota bacterium]
MSDFTRDYQMMLEAYQKADGNPAVFSDSKIAHLVIHKNQVIGSHLVPGLEVLPRETPEGIDLSIKVLPKTKIEYPVHLCFGVLPKEGLQVINLEAEIGEESQIILLAHCIFPNAIKVRHLMQAKILVKKKGYYSYNEVHFHGEDGGVEVVPKAKITLEEGALLETNFQLTKGRVGTLDIDYEVEAGKNSVVEMTAKAYGYGNDKIRIKEKCILRGEASRGIIKSRVAVKEEAESEVVSELSAYGPHSRGHVDCVEIIQEKGKARAVPIVEVFHESAKVTHEAAIGSVDKTQLETLMSRGLKQSEAIDLIIKGMLR